MRQVNAMKRFVMMAICAAMLIGTGVFCVTNLAQTAQPAATQAPAAPAAQVPPSAPASATPVAPAAATPDATASASVETSMPEGGNIKGTVTASGVPLPGVGVTATNSATGKKYATTTEIDGTFHLAVPTNARYVVSTDLTGFATVTQETVVSDTGQNGGLVIQTLQFKMDLASRVTPAPVQAAAATATAVAAAGQTAAAAGKTVAPAGQAAAVTGRTTPGAVQRVGRGTQALTMQNSAGQDLTDASAVAQSTDSLLPSLASSATDSSSAMANESIAVTGVQGQINGLATFSQDDLQNRIGDMQRNGFNNGDIASTLGGVMQTGIFPAGPGEPGGGGAGDGGPGGGGGFGGGPGGGGGFGGGGGGGGGFGGGGGRGGGGGFGGGGRGGGGFGGGGRGGFRGQNPNAWHGTVTYTGSDSDLNATQRIFTGTPLAKPTSDRNTLTVSVTGTPYITGWIAPNPKQFVFLSVSETRNTTPGSPTAIVPTPAQRLGDLTSSYLAQPFNYRCLRSKHRAALWQFQLQSIAPCHRSRPNRLHPADRTQLRSTGNAELLPTAQYHTKLLVSEL